MELLTNRIPELGYKTPLEALKKPFIDSLASNGIYGCTDSRKYTHLFLLEFLTGNNIIVITIIHILVLIFRKENN
jgi:hypothetical protein